MLKTEKYDVDKIFRFILSIIVLGLFFFLVYYLRTILIPFVIAIIIANLLDPVVDFFEKYKIPRVLSIILVFLLIGALFFLLFYFGIPYVINELAQFSKILPNYFDDVKNYILEQYRSLQDETVKENIDTYIDTIVKNLEASQVIEKAMSYVTGLFSQLFNIIFALVGLVIIIMYVFFLLRDIDRLKEKWHLYIPERYRDTVRMVVRDSYEVSLNFFRGQIIIVSILGVLFSIGFTIVDIRIPILFGFTAGILNLIPNFGTLVAIIPGVLLALGRALEPDGGDPLMKAGSILLVFASVQIIQDVVLTPSIMGKRTGLRPATILFSVFIWGKLLGFLGIILAIPLTCLTKVYFAKFILNEETPAGEANITLTNGTDDTDTNSDELNNNNDDKGD